jgi:hypothetical protein
MKQLRVRDVMAREVTTLKRNDQLSLANDIMQLGRIRHLPVLEDDGQLAGILSQNADLTAGRTMNLESRRLLPYEWDTKRGKTIAYEVAIDILRVGARKIGTNDELPVAAAAVRRTAELWRSQERLRTRHGECLGRAINNATFQRTKHDVRVRVFIGLFP